MSNIFAKLGSIESTITHLKTIILCDFLRSQLFTTSTYNSQFKATCALQLRVYARTYNIDRNVLQTHLSLVQNLINKLDHFTYNQYYYLLYTVQHILVQFHYWMWLSCRNICENMVPFEDKRTQFHKRILPCAWTTVLIRVGLKYEKLISCSKLNFQSTNSNEPILNWDFA